MTAKTEKLSNLSRSIADKVVLVTGAGSGIGRATARLLAEQGAVVAATDLTEQALLDTTGPILAAGFRTQSWLLDVSDPVAITRTIPEIADTLGGLDILVNNAGIALPTPVDDKNYEDAWNRSLSVLLTAQMRTVRAALPWLRRSDSPRIINLASTEGLGATKRNSAYVAAKTGVIGLTRALAVELGDEGITVNCVCPGPTHTGMTAAIADEAKAEYARRRTALKRYALPEEIAQAVLFFALPASSFVTGVALPVDGGLTIRNA